jgi:hypothetical protein
MKTPCRSQMRTYTHTHTYAYTYMYIFNVPGITQ